MPLPAFDSNGNLPPGIHTASFAETAARFGVGSAARQQQIGLLREVVDAARHYPTLKRVLLWGSFVTAKPEPNDLDYSVVASVGHTQTIFAPEHRRFLDPVSARIYYGVDKSYLVVYDYPLEGYIEKLDFYCTRRDDSRCGIVELHIRGEFTGETL